jgi:mono/diheme cytochrome c family protein
MASAYTGNSMKFESLLLAGGGLLLSGTAAFAQSVDAGRLEFENRCGGCHGGNGTGGELGPQIVTAYPPTTISSLRLWCEWDFRLGVCLDFK